MLISKAGLATGVFACAAVLSLCSLSSAEPPAGAMPAAVVAQPAVKHSAPYTQLLGTTWTKAPVKFADKQGSTAPAQTVGWRHRAYYAGYGPYGYGYAAPYYAGYYGGYPMGPFSYYTPYVYSYRPWVGGYGGYPYYTGYTPGFAGYYGVGYRGYGGGYYGGGGGYYGGYGGCCYW
jgi:hypothetical protein